jgi:hypothetical protein
MCGYWRTSKCARTVEAFGRKHGHFRAASRCRHFHGAAGLKLKLKATAPPRCCRFVWSPEDGLQTATGLAWTSRSRNAKSRLVGLPDKCLPFAQPDSSLTNSHLTVRPQSGAGPDPNPVIHCFSESLLTTQVFFRRLHGNMSQ